MLADALEQGPLQDHTAPISEDLRNKVIALTEKAGSLYLRSDCILLRPPAGGYPLGGAARNEF